MLSNVRVLEISTLPTMLAGQILGDLGAEVIALEPPGGAPGRRLEPFVGDIPGLERSLTWQALNRNKRGITLRHDDPDGRNLLARLLERFDIVLEAADNCGRLPLDGLSLPPTLIRCATTAFSRSGPKAAYRTEDLILMAASGAPALAGDPDRAPLFFPIPQAMMEAGAEAAVAALAGLAARDRDGLGQGVEVSARTAAVMSALSRAFAGFSGDKPVTRSAAAGSGLTGGRAAPSMYPCADGFMMISVVFGAGFVATTRQIVRWAIEMGALGAEFADVDWLAVGRMAASDPGARAKVGALVEAIRRLCRATSKAALAAAARRYGFMAAPVMTMADIAGSQQYRERGLFASVEVGPAGRAIDVPARFVQFSNYRIEVRRPAPRLSEHTADVLAAELGLSPEEIQALFVHGII